MPSDVREKLTRETIVKLRERLLDLTKNNPLLSFRHSESSRTHIRVVDEIPDLLYGRLVDSDGLIFKALPRAQDDYIPPDERTKDFELAFESARLTDETYLKAVAEAASSEDEESLILAAERALRNKIRKELGMPEFEPKKHVTPRLIAEENGINPEYDLQRVQPGHHPADEHSDRYVQTLLFQDQMDRKLSGIQDKANSDFKEKGVFTLYCAFGFLEWTEQEDSDTRLLAPLLLHPVKLDQTIFRNRWQYRLSAAGERSETISNITLIHKLKIDFGIALPAYAEDDTLDSYFEKVANAFQNIPVARNWRVRRYVTVGTFSFGRIVLYNDLDPDNWPNDAQLHKHSLLLELLGGVDVKNGKSDNPKPPLSTLTNEPLLVTDADSSQIEAIMDVLAGNNTVIYGPPGTGKSQTIANLIGAALNEGKKVLFLAEKMAALEVVHKRLKEYGLSQFCLEIHSVGTNKRALLDSLDERLSYSAPRTPRTLVSMVQQKQKLQDRLDNYVAVINSPFPPIDQTVHSILWTAQQLADESNAIALPVVDRDIRIDTSALTEPILREVCSSLDTLESAAVPVHAESSSVDEYPWWGLERKSLTAFDAQRVVHAAFEWQKSRTALLKLAETIHQTTGIQCTNDNDLHAFRAAIANLPKSDGDLDQGFLAILTSPDLVKEAHPIVSDYRNYGNLDKLLRRQLGSVENLDLRREFLVKAVSSVKNLPDEIRTLTLKDSKEAHRKLMESIESLRRIDSFLKEVSSATALVPARTLSDAYRLVYAFTTIAKARPEVLMNLNSAICDGGSAVVLEEAETRANSLKQEMESLSRELKVSLTDDPTTLRLHAATIRSAGFFQRLGKKFKQAFAKYKSLCVGEPSADRLEAAAKLESLAKLIEAFKEFANSEQYKRALGPKFDGHQTNFGLLKEICAHAREVNRQFAGNEELPTSLRRLLLEANADVHNTCVAFASQSEFKFVRSYLLNEHQSKRSLKVNVEEAIVTGSKTAQAIATSCEALSQAQYEENELLAGVQDALSSLDTYSQVRNRVKSETLLRTSLNRTTEEMAQSAELLASTAAFADRIFLSVQSQQILRFVFSAGYLETSRVLTDFGSQIDERLSIDTRLRAAFADESQLDFKKWLPQGDLIATPFAEIVSRLSKVNTSGVNGLMTWITFLKALQVAQQSVAAPMVETYIQSRLKLVNLALAFRFLTYRTLAERAFSQHPVLAEFSGLQQEKLRRDFAKLDQEILELQREALAAKLGEKSIPPGLKVGNKRDWTDRALIDHEVSKKTKHIPLRDLLDRSFDALIEMKPCFMMSPVSAAQFLKPGKPRFDLIVIDEASQMRPEDAVSAIARSRQLVVVGDPEQLPPTSFFNTTLDGATMDDSDIPVDESILDAAKTMFSTIKRLKWHYRSQHESLIAFSNHNFYRDELLIFPSPGTQSGALGVRSHQVNGLYKKGLNPAEVESIVERASQIMETEIDSSIGIVAMNQKQKDLLQAEFEALFLRSDSAQRYRDKWQSDIESFFVKNLENVQGDERDIILISTVYGPEEEGVPVLQTCFGPINTATGHRRLNVLFTRARRRIELFTSLKPSDVLPSGKGHDGPGILRNYLEFARTGRLSTGVTSNRDPDSEFEILVMDRLKKRGFEVEPQVGVAGFFIDIGVRDPSGSGTFILGVECDGARYHSSKNARDRDRIRQSALERRGWQIHRVWSADWFNDSDGEMSKLVKRIQLSTLAPYA